MNISFDRELDAKGLNCPMPMLQAKRHLKEMSAGQVLKVISTESAAPRDFSNFAKQTGNELLASTEDHGSWTLFIRKG